MHSFDVKGKIHSLGSCMECIEKNIVLLKKIQNNEILTEMDIHNECNNCCDWNYQSRNAHFIVADEDYKSIEFFYQKWI